MGWGVKLNFDKDKTDAAVAAIHAQKITLADVEGKNLPPVSDQAENDATVAGIDKNNNGVRDDVELVIFKKYPNSAKIRAAELQYAVALQLMITKVFDSGSWEAAAQEESRANYCIAETYPRSDLGTFGKVIDMREKEVEDSVLNTEMRKVAEETANKYIVGYVLPNTDICNIDLKTLPN